MMEALQVMSLLLLLALVKGQVVKVAEVLSLLSPLTRSGSSVLA